MCVSQLNRGKRPRPFQEEKVECAQGRREEASPKLAVSDIVPRVARVEALGTGHQVLHGTCSRLKGFGLDAEDPGLRLRV